MIDPSFCDSTPFSTSSFLDVHGDGSYKWLHPVEQYGDYLEIEWARMRYRFDFNHGENPEYEPVSIDKAINSVKEFMQKVRRKILEAYDIANAVRGFSLETIQAFTQLKLGDKE